MPGRGRRDGDLARAAYGSGRVSAPRMTIANVVDASRGHAFSVEELASRVRRVDAGIGMATVYRAVAAMEAAGFVEPLGDRDGAALYAACPPGAHHHHMLCTSCSAVADVDCPVPAIPGTGPSADFRVTGHRLVLYGLCGPCSSHEGSPDATVEPDCCGSERP